MHNDGSKRGWPGQASKRLPAAKGSPPQPCLARPRRRCQLDANPPHPRSMSGYSDAVIAYASPPSHWSPDGHQAQSPDSPAAKARTHGRRPAAAGRGTVDPRTVRRWVQDRQSGISLVAIARDGDTTAEKVGRATKPYGPFPSPQRAPAGYMTFRQVSARLGISRPALQRRLEQGELPEPAGHSDSGWPYWRAGDIEQWIATLAMNRCRICGAYLKRLDWHMISRHGQPRTQRPPRRDG